MPHDALSPAGFNDDKAENILENRRRFLKLFSGDWALAGCWQVQEPMFGSSHSWKRLKPAENEQGDTIYCDAIVSNTPGVLAGVKTADCVPILLGDPKTGAFAAVHAGWRGTLTTIVQIAVRRLVSEFGVRTENLRVAIGAAAGPCCYEVGQDVIDAFFE